MIPTPNSVADVGFNRDRFLFSLTTSSLKYYKFLGLLMGMAIRTKKSLNLHLAPTIWKQLAGIQLTLKDIEEVCYGSVGSTITL